MIRPFISSAGRCSTDTTDSLVCSLASRWMASVTIFLARCWPSFFASFSMSLTATAASRLAWVWIVVDQFGLGFVGREPGDAFELVVLPGCRARRASALPAVQVLASLVKILAALIQLAQLVVQPALALGDPDLAALQVAAELPGLGGDER